MWLLVLVPWACGAPPLEPSAARPGDRVGTYDGRAVAVAYANGPLFAARMRELREAHNAAEDRQDEAEMAALEARTAVPRSRDGAAPRDPRPSNRSPASPPPRSPQLMDKLTELYVEEPYPTVERMEEIAKDVGAPDYKKIESFFVNMRLKHQERHQ